MYAIEAVKLYKSYKAGVLNVEVLKGIDMQIQAGEFISIMGPSGSGKSTFLYLAGGLDNPTSGTVRINGSNIPEMNDRELSIMRRRSIGFIFQFYNLIPNLSVEENIMLPAMLDGNKAIDLKKTLKELVDITGLARRIQHFPAELSGGEQQRTAIARALINDPAIILADEPTGNLDTENGTGILELLKRISRERGKTIIMVTHSAEAAVYSQRTVFMKDGRLVEQ
jgi:putative ABC transport system ATP-binding protein